MKIIFLCLSFKNLCYHYFEEYTTFISGNTVMKIHNFMNSKLRNIEDIFRQSHCRML